MISKREKWLVVLFLVTLPIVNPWIRGDGVGYYAYARALLIQHNLDFRQDWLHANTSFLMGRVDSQGHLTPEQFTPTGHLDNHFTIGPALLWSPFLIVVHAAVVTADKFGAHISADGFSRPYRDVVAVATCLYSFLALLLSYRLASKYFEPRWAFLATLGIWFASSLPVYMYFNPSWSHALSAFTVALFLVYWDRTRPARTVRQWIVLGLIGGLMVDVYYPNIVVVIVPLLESLRGYWKSLRHAEPRPPSAAGLLIRNLLFALVALAAFFPTLLTKKIIYGGFLDFGYTEHCYWKSPALKAVCFSSDHGLFSWTPILIFAVAGLFFAMRFHHEKQRGEIALYFLAAFAGFLYLMGCYELWDGLSSFGSRFFVSLTPIFVFGLAALLDSCARSWRSRAMPKVAALLVSLFIVWNLEFAFQWGMHMVPSRGPISFRQMAYSQVTDVPVRLSHTFFEYLAHRKVLMKNIEDTDVRQLKKQFSNQSQPQPQTGGPNRK